jgi:hypothetical protein
MDPMNSVKNEHYNIVVKHAGSSSFVWYDDKAASLFHSLSMMESYYDEIL